MQHVLTSACDFQSHKTLQMPFVVAMKENCSIWRYHCSSVYEMFPWYLGIFLCSESFPQFHTETRWEKHDLFFSVAVSWNISCSEGVWSSCWPASVWQPRTRTAPAGPPEPEFSPLIGPAPMRPSSHWLDLLLGQPFFCHKEPARASKDPTGISCPPLVMA